jgi:hypothetical protein
MSERADPFDVPMVLFRVGWMDHYRGVTAGDRITGGGSFVAENEFGHEMFNFQPVAGRVYGYVQPTVTEERWSDATINLSKIARAATGDSLPGVLAVWVATLKGRGGFVVGWYRNATVYRQMQPAPPGSNRRHGSEDFGYFASARCEDAVLLPDHERVYRVPQATAGGFGKSNVFFANDPAKHQRLRAGLLRYIETRRVPRASEQEAARQPDPLLRQQVEKAAIRETVRHFRRLGYAVGSVERDNVGWDLNAVNAVRELRLEVKGLSGSDAVVDLTPNEYRAMRQHRDSYRVCVVTNALTDPSLEVFAYSRETSRWESPAGRVLAVEEIVAARCSAGEAP